MGKDATNVIQILGDHLGRLSRSGLDDFLVALCGIEAPRGCHQIQMERLKGKTPVEAANIIINSYTVNHGPVKVREALRNINENQIRVDLQKDLRGVKDEKRNPEEAEPAPRTSGGQVNAKEPEKIVRAGNRPQTTASAQPTGGDTECEPGTSQQPAEEIKPRRGRKPKNEPKITEKSPVKAQTSNGAAGGKRAREEPSEDEEKPKRARKPPASSDRSPRMGGGRVSAEEPKKIAGAEYSPKTSAAAKPTRADTECDPGTSQQPAEEIKPRRGRKPKTETKAIEKSPVKAQPSGGAAGGKRARKEPSEDEEKPKPANKNNFVNENRNNLIKLITQVDPVLDHLLQEKLLTREQYDNIRKKSSSQERMRQLLTCVDHEQNDQFLPILEKHYPTVIKNLKKKANLEN
ncbi:uncharacterized protein ACNLHF_026267 isoform 2-T2 [Anomaloglossus baeobatrachus]|uniref:uncharacterized protein LOC142245696 isoform X2 n=1 Tax=Anomaloglossus baeobatrachus TaxID=238106 RepID=UPI003F50CAA8